MRMVKAESAASHVHKSRISMLVIIKSRGSCLLVYVAASVVR